MLKPGEPHPLLQPVAVAPARDAPSAPAVSHDAFPPPLLLLDVLSANVDASSGSSDLSSEEGRQLLVSIKLSSAAAASAGAVSFRADADSRPSPSGHSIEALHYSMSGTSLQSLQPITAQALLHLDVQSQRGCNNIVDVYSC